MKVEFLDVEFDNLTTTESARLLADRPSNSSFSYVVTPNVDHMLALAGDERLKQIYRDAGLCVCDSRVLALLAKLAGIRLSVTTGSDLTAMVLGDLREGDRICLIGSDAESVKELGRRLPGVDIRHHAPPMGLRHNEEANQAAADFVIGSRARYTFLAVGFPQQEMLAARIAKSGSAIGVGLCVGAAVNFYIGKERRAPKWMQRLTLEWLHRLLHQPRRLAKRYVVDGPHILPLYLRWMMKRGR